MILERAGISPIHNSDIGKGREISHPQQLYLKGQGYLPSTTVILEREGTSPINNSERQPFDSPFAAITTKKATSEGERGGGDSFGNTTL